MPTEHFCPWCAEPCDCGDLMDCKHDCVMGVDLTVRIVRSAFEVSDLLYNEDSEERERFRDYNDDAKETPP